MKASRVVIRRIGNHDHLEVNDIGEIIRLSGRNGSGKTSFIAALQALFLGGNKPELIKQGCEDAEIEMTIQEDDLPPLLIRKRMTKKGFSLKVLRRTGDKVEELSRPQELIDSFLDALSFDPVEFLTAKPEQRVEALLEALPIEVTEEELLKIIGAWAGSLFTRGLPNGHALVVLDQIIDVLYAERTAINRVVKEKSDTVKQLMDSLPPAEDLKTDWPGKLKALISDRDTLQAAKADELRLAQARAKAEESPVLSDYENSLKTWREEKERKLKEIHEVFAERERRIRQIKERRLEEIGQMEAKEESGIVKTYAEQLEWIAGEISQAQERAQAHAKARGALETVRAMEQEAVGSKARSDDLTARLDRLDAKKAELLGKLPIKGLEVKGGKLFYEGLLFDQVNLSRRILLAVEIAKLRAKRLPIVVLDGIERLDRQSREEIERKAIEAGLQVFETQVEDETADLGLHISAVGAGVRS